jgi:hypothetical protein
MITLHLHRLRGSSQVAFTHSIRLSRRLIENLYQKSGFTIVIICHGLHAGHGQFAAFCLSLTP